MKTIFQILQEKKQAAANASKTVITSKGSSVLASETVMFTDGVKRTNPFSAIKNFVTQRGAKLYMKNYLNPDHELAYVHENSPVIQDGKAVRHTIVDSLVMPQVDRTKVNESFIPTAFKGIMIPDFGFGLDNGIPVEQGIGDNAYHHLVGVVAYDAKTNIVVKVLTNKEIVMNKSNKFDDITINGVVYKVAVAKFKTNQLVYTSDFKDGYDVAPYVTKEKYSIVAGYRAILIEIAQGTNRKAAVMLIPSGKEKNLTFPQSALTAAKGNGLSFSISRHINILEKTGFIQQGAFNKNLEAKYKIGAKATPDTIIIHNGIETSLKDFMKMIGFEVMVFPLDKAVTRKKGNMKEGLSELETTIAESEELEDDDDDTDVDTDEKEEEGDDFADLD